MSKKKKREKRTEIDCEVVIAGQGQRTHFMKMYFGKDKERGKYITIE